MIIKKISLKKINCILLMICIIFGSLYQTGKSSDILKRISLIGMDQRTAANISDVKKLDNEDAITEPYARNGEIEKRESCSGQNILKLSRILIGSMSVSPLNSTLSLLFFIGLYIGGQGQTYALSRIKKYINDMDGIKPVNLQSRK